MQSDDPDFERKAADVIGLYVNPPQHAAVFAVDEKTAIQALDRLDPVLPLSPGRAERHGFEYYRHGTLSLFAALNTQTGEVVGQTVPRHTSDAFVDFFGDSWPASRARRRFTSSSTIWPRTRRRRCERFSSTTRRCGCISRRPIRPGSTKSSSGSRTSSATCWRGASSPRSPISARRIRTYIRHYNKAAKPIRWSYRNRRIELVVLRPIQATSRI